MKDFKKIIAAFVALLTLTQLPLGHCLEPSKIKMSPSSLGRLRSELRAGRNWFDYHDIQNDKEFKRLVRQKELEIKDKYVDSFIKIIRRVAEEKQASGIESLIRDAVQKNAMIDELEVRQSKTNSLVRKIKKILLADGPDTYILRAKKLREMLNREWTEYVRSLFDFKIIFSGIPKGGTNAVGQWAYDLLKSIDLGESIFGRMMRRSGNVTVSSLDYFPESVAQDSDLYDFLSSLDADQKKRILSGVINQFYQSGSGEKKAFVLAAFNFELETDFMNYLKGASLVQLEYLIKQIENIHHDPDKMKSILIMNLYEIFPRIGPLKGNKILQKFGLDMNPDLLKRLQNLEYSKLEAIYHSLPPGRRFSGDMRRFDLIRDKKVYEVLKHSSRRRTITGIVIYFDSNDLGKYPITYGNSSYEIPNHYVWVLPNGLLAINLKKISNNFKAGSQSLLEVFAVPYDFEEGLESGRYEILPPDMLGSVFGYEHLDRKQFGDLRELIHRQERKIKSVLNRKVRFYFSGFQFGPEDEQPGKTVKSIVEFRRFAAYFHRAMVNEEVTVPIVESTLEDVKGLEFGKLTNHPWLLQLKDSPVRLPVGDILFFYDSRPSMVQHAQIGGDSYDIPSSVPMWTVRRHDGRALLAINVNHLVRDEAAIISIMEAALVLPQRQRPQRSETRSAIQKLDLPKVPDMPAKEAEKILPIFGVQPHRDFFIFERSLFESPQGLALALTVFARSEARFVILGYDESDPWIKSLNAKLAFFKENPLLVAPTADQAVRLLRAEIRDSGRKLGATRLQYNIRAILGSSSTVDAEALKKQVDEVKFMAPDQFIQMAAGISERFGFSDYVSELQAKLFSQSAFSESA